MGDEVEIEFVGKDAGLSAQWASLRNEIKKTSADMKGFETTSKDTDNSFKLMAGGIVKGLAAVSFAAKAAQIVVGELSAKYQQSIQNASNAGNFQLSAAAAQRAALRNLGQGEITPQLLQQRIAGISKSTGADMTSLYQAASGVLSARGGMSQTEALNQLAAVAKLDASLPASEMQSMAGASLDIRKAFDGTPEQSLGAMLASQQTARVENTGQFAQNVVPALKGLKAFGGDFRSSSAIVAAISQESGDVQGAQSGTAAITLAKQVQQATANVPELQGKGTAERLAWLRSDKGARVRHTLLGSLDAKAKMSKNEKGELTGEAKQYMAMAGLMTPGSSAMEAYEAAYAVTPTIEGGGEVYQKNIEIQKDLDIQKTAKAREQARGQEQADLSDGAEGLRGVVREDLEKKLKRMGFTGWVGPFQEKAEMAGFDAAVFRGVDPSDAAAAVLEQRGNTSLSPVSSRLKNASPFGSWLMPKDGDFNKADVSGNAMLQALQENTKELRAAAEARREAQHVIVDKVAETGAPDEKQRAQPSGPPVGALRGPAAAGGR